MSEKRHAKWSNSEAEGRSVGRLCGSSAELILGNEVKPLAVWVVTISFELDAIWFLGKWSVVLILKTQMTYRLQHVQHAQWNV